jgi:hypothetical protein
VLAGHSSAAASVKSLKSPAWVPRAFRPRYRKEKDGGERRLEKNDPERRLNGQVEAKPINKWLVKQQDSEGERGRYAQQNTGNSTRYITENPHCEHRVVREKNERACPI